MRKIKLLQYLLLAVLCAPGMASAQQFTNAYSFTFPMPTAYQNSVHTDAVQLPNSGDIAEAGTVDNPYSPGQNVVQMGVIDLAGNMSSPAFFYSNPEGAHLEAVDMYESVDPDNVIQVANYRLPGDLNRIEVFKTDPYGMAGISWVRRLGLNLEYHLYGAAIIGDQAGYYYVLGYIQDPDPAISWRTPYLAKLDDGGNVMWEQIYYFMDDYASHESVDLLFDEETQHVIFAANRYYPYPVRDGIAGVEVDAVNGAFIAASWVPTLDGTPEFVVRDIDLTSDREYAFVGHIFDQQPDRGYMVRYQQGMIPAAGFSTIYAAPDGIFMTGVKPYFGGQGGVYMSFDWGMAAGFVWPGMVEALPNGDIVAPPLYYFMQNAKYIASSGLVEINGYRDFAIKGATDFAGLPSLSMTADFTPLVPDPASPICSEKIEIEYYESDEPKEVEFFEELVDTWKRVKMEYTEFHGEYYDCDGNNIGSFRKARPATGIAKEENSIDISIYPNPGNGLFTIEGISDNYRTAEIYNALGKVVMTFNVNNTTERIDLSGYAPGIYLLRMKGNDGMVSEPHRIMIK